MQPTPESRLQTRQRPPGRPVMRQDWRDLLFLHWRCDPEAIQQTLPAGLTVDTYDGHAWVGIVPFKMRRIRPARCPSVPYISNFLELNLRTYVHDEHGTPGVWFYSLDASRLLAVLVARVTFRLPYYWSRMSTRVDGEGMITYRCRRWLGANRQQTEFRYRQSGPLATATPGTLEFFLVERYVLFSLLPDARLATGRVHHPPYRFAPCEVTRWDTSVFRMQGLDEPGDPPAHAIFSPGVEVEVFSLDR